MSNSNVILTIGLLIISDICRIEFAASTTKTIAKSRTTTIATTTPDTHSYYFNKNVNNATIPQSTSLFGSSSTTTTSFVLSLGKGRFLKRSNNDNGFRINPNHNINNNLLIKLGAIFEKDSDHLITAFHHAIDRINSGPIFNTGIKFIPKVKTIGEYDSFHASRVACDLIKEGVWAIFGPRTSSANWLVTSLTNALHIPHVTMFWDSRAHLVQHNMHPSMSSSSVNSSGSFSATTASFQRLMGTTLSQSPSSSHELGRIEDEYESTTMSMLPSLSAGADFNPYSFTHNFYPESSSFSKCLLDFILSRNWKSFTIVYESKDDLIKMKELLSATSLIRDLKVTVKQVVITGSHQDVPVYRKLFKDLNKLGETNIVIATGVQNLRTIMTQAQEVGMMTEYHNYLIASLDLHLVDLSLFAETQANITAFSILDSSSSLPSNTPPIVSFSSLPIAAPSFLAQTQNVSPSKEPRIGGIWTSPPKRPHFMSFYSERKLTTEQALIYDAVDHFSRSIHKIFRVNLLPEQTLTKQQASCEKLNPWPSGRSVLYHLRAVNMKGLTGNIKFNEFGQRVDYLLDVVQLKRSGMSQIGTWTLRSGMNSSANYTEMMQFIREKLANKTLRVTTALSRPYMMLRENHEYLQDNDRFEGYCVDLLDEIASRLGFKYELQLVRDGAYGSKSRRTGEWNGMIRELQDREADLAITDFTITSLRQTAVDFTMPFMNLGIAILFKKPEDKGPEFFYLLKPFATQLWLAIGGCAIGVALLLWFLAHITPYEWRPKHPCDNDPDELHNQFTLASSIWFVFSSLMQQGTQLAPQALSTRTLATTWYFFTLIIICSYTANLAAFLTSSRMAFVIESADDLVAQNEIKYGCKKGGSTESLFRTSTQSTFTKMWSVMESNDSNFAATNEEGIRKVKAGGYAFMMESTSIKYIVQRECDLVQIGSELDSKGYGIALPFNSPYRDLINVAIVQLREENKLVELETKWWVERGGGKCSPKNDDSGKKSSSSSTNEMDLNSVGGVFIVLTVGIALSCLFVAIEFTCKFIGGSRRPELVYDTSVDGLMNDVSKLAFRETEI